MKAPLGFAMPHERKLILLLCAIAAVRVFIFSAAFPFFNNVDEQAHVDLVMKYSRGELPRDLGHYSSEAAYYIALYGTPEFLMAPQQFETNDFPSPNWILPVEQRDAAINRISAWWRSNENHESGEPPLYYAIAGLWLNLGRVFGITGAWLLYWVRFLNVFVAGTLVWAGYVAAKLVFPDRQFIHLSVPILLGVWPQSTFYSIQSDSLSPLCFGIAFVGLIKFLRDDPTSLPLAIWTGLALAATCLTKTTNIALLLVAGIALVFKIRNLAQRRTLRLRLVSLAVLIGSAAVPIALWFAWNVHTFGDLTASSSKIDFLGWTRKPVSNWWPHPIFTLNGVKEFWPELMASFWRGEFVWYGKRLASNASDAFYWISSTLAIGVAVFSLFPRLTKLNEFQRESLWLAFSSFAVLVVFVALLSIAFDFGVCPYPSREHPYFTSGRLLSAAAVPFFLLYAWALDWTTCRLTSNWLRLFVFGGIVIALTIPQTLLNCRAFSSHYNFFHMGGSTTPVEPSRFAREVIVRDLLDCASLRSK
jgi:hypothetical protein